MADGRNKPHFMQYFPDIFFKKLPPKKYFWSIYASLEPESFKTKYNQILDRVLLRITRPESILVTEEHKQLMAQKKSENIKLSLALKRPGLTQNIIYLKKVRRTGTKNTILERYLQPLANEKEHSEQSEADHVYESD